MLLAPLGLTDSRRALCSDFFFVDQPVTTQSGCWCRTAMEGGSVGNNNLQPSVSDPPETDVREQQRLLLRYLSNVVERTNPPQTGHLVALVGLKFMALR